MGDWLTLSPFKHRCFHCGGPRCGDSAHGSKEIEQALMAIENFEFKFLNFESQSQVKSKMYPENIKVKVCMYW